MRLPFLLLCLTALGNASTIQFFTSTSCTSLTTVTDPNSCTVSDWISTEDASASFSVFNGIGVASLSTDAGPNGAWQSEGIAVATITAEISGYYNFEVDGSAMGDDASSTVSIEIDGQDWSIQDNGALQFDFFAGPGDLTATATTQGQGYASLAISFVDPPGPPSQVPEPASVWLICGGFICLLAYMARKRYNLIS